jgi:hypothetical protein
MARRINGEGTVWYVKSEKRWRGQYFDQKTQNYWRERTQSS